MLAAVMPPVGINFTCVYGTARALIIPSPPESSASSRKEDAMNNIFEKIRAIGILPVIALDDAAQAVPLARSLAAGGLGDDELVEGMAAAVGLALPEGRGLGGGDVAGADAVALDVAGDCSG